VAPDDEGPPIRDAATVVLLKRCADGQRVLMGQRGGRAVFMPDLFVFPGGAVDADDVALDAVVPLEPETARRLAVETAPEVARALPLAAVRELWEETGLVLGRPDAAAAARAVPEGWRAFHAAGFAPETAALRLIFRAVTPRGRPRRFDARFFLADAAALAAVGHDFAGAGGELGNLSWVDLPAARALPLPFVTEVVLSEIAAIAAEPETDRPVPFLHQRADGARFSLL
jgi:8-oxo-dGTP pyrophosphatase MutT (NUDIX family)